MTEKEFVFHFMANLGSEKRDLSSNTKKIEQAVLEAMDLYLMTGVLYERLSRKTSEPLPGPTR